MTLSEIFEQHGFRLTKPRQQIFDILKIQKYLLPSEILQKTTKTLTALAFIAPLLYLID